MVVKNFTKHTTKSFPMPDLYAIQKSSYQWFWDQGIRELFKEIFPIEDFTGKLLELKFVDFRLEEPKTNDIEAKERNLSYEASLRARFQLVIKETNEIKEQEIFLGDFPVMTPRGTFIVNGVERVVISQLIRSPGVFFTSTFFKGKQLFGAKIIPYRGAWLEFDMDFHGAIYVKIDRKRKIAATALLRFFGLKDDKEILAAFADLSQDGINPIAETIKRDISKERGEALVEIYKRIRPGDLATVDNARQLIEAMFFNISRYDLSRVGRWKMSQRLHASPVSRKYKEKPIHKNEISADERILDVKDIIDIMREISRFSKDPLAKPDNIDHLGNRRVRAVGELLQNRLRIGLTRMERIIRDRMSTLDVYTITPVQIMNARPFIAAVKEFFASSQLSQFMDNQNPLAELEHKRRLSAMGPGGLTRERAGFEVRDVQPSHYGRICPIQTPEGPNIGLVEYLASYARVNEFGFIETPYRKVKNSRITNEVEFLNAFEEEKYNIAHANVELDMEGKIADKIVEARVRGEASFIARSEVDYIDVSPQQIVSIATSLIPFLEHDDANRALMGSNMQRQAVPCVNPEPPLVATGIEEKAARDSGQVIIADFDGRVINVDACKIAVKGVGKKQKTYVLRKFARSNQYTSINHKPLVRKGDRVFEGSVLADGPATKDGQLALGRNVLVAFMPWRGLNFEDAIVISERVAKSDYFSSIHIEDFSCDVRETKLGSEITTSDIPNVGEDKLSDLDEEGIVRIGAEVGPGDILVGKISPKGEVDLTPEERLLRAIFGEKARDVKDSSLLLPHGKRGRVVNVKIFSREFGDRLLPGVIKQIQIEVAHMRRVSVGDKLSGRHGNKGVIAQILPEEDMPFLGDGTPVNVILNPLGVISRMNIGQTLETHLGWAAKKLGYQAITPVFSGATEKEIKDELRKAGGVEQDGKVTLYDGYTGEAFVGKVTIGYLYMMKLIHMVEDKIHMRSIGPYSLITQQPLGGKAQFGGQRFGEMEVWALEGHGAAHTLQEMLTYKSDDVPGRAAVYESIIRGRDIQAPQVPASFHVLVNELKAIGLDVELTSDEFKDNDEETHQDKKLNKKKTL